MRTSNAQANRIEAKLESALRAMLSPGMAQRIISDVDKEHAERTTPTFGRRALAATIVAVCSEKEDPDDAEEAVVKLLEGAGL